VKAMEDCKLNYDNTVRNASGSIIQFLYGEDGMDGSKIENQIFTYIDNDYTKMKKEYHLTKEDDLSYILSEDCIKEFTGNKNWEEIFDIHFKIVLSDREFLIKKIFNDKRDNNIMYPISFFRIINSAKALYNKHIDVLSDLNPMYVLSSIDKLTKELFINKNNPGNKFLGMLIRHNLSPKRVIFQYQFTKNAFDYVIQQIRLKFYDAVANPSEMVGVIAAQSIGEP
jgi:DNA-directed RNA polymerase II subunit RPB1